MIVTASQSVAEFSNRCSSSKPQSPYIYDGTSRCCVGSLNSLLSVGSSILDRRISSDVRIRGPIDPEASLILHSRIRSHLRGDTLVVY